MVSNSKTIVSRSRYEAPVCRIYSITVESTVMNASGYGENDHAGDDLGGGNEYGL